jgi:hypothetical protein
MFWIDLAVWLVGHPSHPNSTTLGQPRSRRTRCGGPLQHSKLQRFGEMVGGDALVAGQVRDRSGDFADAIVAAGTQLHPDERAVQ